MEKVESSLFESTENFIHGEVTSRPMDHILGLTLGITKRNSDIWSRQFIVTLSSLYTFGHIFLDVSDFELAVDLWDKVIKGRDFNTLELLLQSWNESISNPNHVARNRYARILFLRHLDPCCGGIKY